jgi:hypothetical protein
VALCSPVSNIGASCSSSHGRLPCCHQARRRWSPSPLLGWRRPLPGISCRFVAGALAGLHQLEIVHFFLAQGHPGRPAPRARIDGRHSDVCGAAEWLVTLKWPFFVPLSEGCPSAPARRAPARPQHPPRAASTAAAPRAPAVPRRSTERHPDTHAGIGCASSRPLRTTESRLYDGRPKAP